MDTINSKSKLNIQDAHKILLSFTDNADQSKVVNDFVHEVKAIHEPKIALQSIIGSIYDGLRYGNWIWNIKREHNG